MSAAPDATARPVAAPCPAHALFADATVAVGDPAVRHGYVDVPATYNCSLLVRSSVGRRTHEGRLRSPASATMTR